jgi:hypothetical protein
MEAATTTTTHNGEQPPMSKRAMKRLARTEHKREQRKVKKQARKLERHSATNEVDEEHEKEHFPNWEKLPHEPLNPSRQEKKQLLLTSFAKAQSSITIAIDCAFENYMTDQEKKVSFCKSN